MLDSDASLGRNEGSNLNEWGNEALAQRSVPSISLPKGGGTIRGMGVNFIFTPVTDISLLTTPMTTSPSCSEFGLQLLLFSDYGTSSGLFSLRRNLPFLHNKVSCPHFLSIRQYFSQRMEAKASFGANRIIMIAQDFTNLIHQSFRFEAELFLDFGAGVWRQVISL